VAPHPPSKDSAVPVILFFLKHNKNKMLVKSGFALFQAEQESFTEALVSQAARTAGALAPFFRMARLYLASWNVAGWLTTVKHVNAQHGSVGKWLERHNFDVLCLQEVKTNERQVEQSPNDHAAFAPGYDSFWAPSRLRNAKGGLSGMAGVATFVKAGCCQHASRNCLDDGGVFLKLHTCSCAHTHARTHARVRLQLSPF